MSAVDDLRAAAKLLRKRIAALPPAFPQTSDPWRPVLTDTESLTGVAACNRPASEHIEDEACDECWFMETWYESVADYSASVHPLVGLALARLLDEHADCLEEDGGEVTTSDADEAVKVARVYLGRSS